VSSAIKLNQFVIPIPVNGGAQQRLGLIHLVLLNEMIGINRDQARVLT
jgi:hypothetical protein